MAYEKARELLDLAIALSGSHYGLGTAEIEARLAETAAKKQSPSALERQRQRMLGQIDALFPAALEIVEDEEKRKRWKLRTKDLNHLPLVEPADLAALDRARNVLKKRGDTDGASRLGRHADALRMAIDADRRRRLETDFEALREAQAVVMQPGPFAKVDPAVEGAVSEAILKGVCLAFDYPDPKGIMKRRTVEPVGVLLGPRTYLVARTATAPADGTPSHWRMDRMTGPGVVSEPARAMPEGFALDTHARKLFGVYWNEAEYEDVEWRFAPRAAASAAAWRFHPDQSLQHHDDGSLTVRFQASGHLEMAWHLYQWGDAVAVVKPEAVAEMVAGYRRDDFGVLP